MRKYVTVNSNGTRRRFQIGGYYRINFPFGNDFIRIVADKNRGYLIQKVYLSKFSVPEIRLDCKENLLSEYGKTVKSDQREFEQAFDMAVQSARKLQIALRS